MSTIDEASAGQAARALASAVRMLGQREHSEAELRRKLTRKHSELSPDQLDAVIDELIENGWQSDVRYAETLIRSRINRGYGPHYIVRELVSKGINANLAQEALAEQAQDWQALAGDLVSRRHPAARDCAADWQRAARFLQRRGFSAEVVVRALGSQPYPEAAAD